MATKHQHYVPQHYLQAWADCDKNITVWNDFRPCKKQSISNTAVATKIYTLTNPSLQECECILAHCHQQKYPRDVIRLLFQSCVYPIWREHIIQNTVAEDDVNIAEFLIDNELVDINKIQFMHGWLQNHLLNNPPGDWNQSAIPEGLEPFMTAVENDFWPILDGIRANPDFDFYEERHKMYQYLAVQIFRTPKFCEGASYTSPMKRVLMSLDCLLWMIRRDEICQFRVSRISISGNHKLLSCDNPVVDYYKSKQHVLLFPISPELCLFCYQPENPSQQTIDAIFEDVTELNRIICENAYHEIYATDFDTMRQEAHRFGVFKNYPFLQFGMQSYDTSASPSRFD